MSAKQKERFTQLSWGFAEWTERHKDGLDPEAIAVAAVLMGWPEANWSGVFIVALGALERRALLRSPASVREAMAKLEAVDFLVYCEDTRLVWVKNLAKRHCHGATDGKSRNVWSTLRSIGAPAAWFWADFWTYCEADLGLSQSGLSKPAGKSVRPASSPLPMAPRANSHTPLVGGPPEGAVTRPLHTAPANGALAPARLTPRKFKAASLPALIGAHAPNGGPPNGGVWEGPPHQSREVRGKRGEGPAHTHTHAREDSTLTIPRSQLEAEIAESQSKVGTVHDPVPEPMPLVPRGVLHPRELTPEEIAILETPIGGDDAFDLTAPMPELPSMKGRSRQTYVEKAKELYAHQAPEIQAKRIAEVEVYQAKIDAKEAEAAAVRDPEDAAFEEAMATWLDLYPSVDERANKLIKRSVSEIPQGLEGHHDACRQAATTIGSKYSKAVGAPLGMPAKVAIMRGVLLLTEDSRVSVPGAVDRLSTMLDWWTATDGNPKRRSSDGKDWFADVMAVFGGKETVQAASGVPRDAGSVLMVNLNAAAAWKHARDRKLDVSKDPFGGGKETYYGIMDAIRDGKWGTQ